MGRETPTVIITNGRDINTVPDRAVRPADDHRTTPRRDLQAFCADALSSTVNLDVDLDIVLCVLAQALLAAFRARLGPGYTTATPDTLQRRFLDTPGTILNDADTITVILNRRATHRPCANPTSPQTQSSPGGKAANSASSSPDKPEAESAARKSR
jgi:hypothetical protein